HTSPSLYVLPSFSTIARPPPRSTLFPYTTLFRSEHQGVELEAGLKAAHLPQEGSAPPGGQVKALRQSQVGLLRVGEPVDLGQGGDRKSTRLNSSHVSISYAVFCLKKKKRAQARVD